MKSINILCNWCPWSDFWPHGHSGISMYMLQPLWFVAKRKVMKRFYFKFFLLLSWDWRLLLTVLSHSTIGAQLTSCRTEDIEYLTFVSWMWVVCQLLWPALSRCPEGSGNSNSNAPLDQKFLLKWSVPLSFVDILEFGSSEDMADSSHYPAPHSGEKVVINAKPSTNHSLISNPSE